MNDRLEFAHDENNPKEWFLHKTADKQGFPLQFNRGGTRLRNKYICKTYFGYSESQGERDILGIERPGKDRAGVILQNNTLLSPFSRRTSPNYKPVTSVVCPKGECLSDRLQGNRYLL